MKNIMVALILGAGVLSSVSSYAVEEQEIKCYVSLLGGEETIYFGFLPKEPLTKTAKELVNKRILTTLSPQKKQVYKVYECILQKDLFSSSAARNLEKNIEL